MIPLGVKAKDKITGFKGIVTGRHTYITGCDQYTIQGGVNEAGEVRQGQFDETRIEVLDPRPVFTDPRKQPGSPGAG